jgi:hypothetical protein
MTPTQLLTAVRQEYNAVNETFWSDSELLGLVWAACLEIATETLCIERIYTTTTIADTQEYAYPTNVIALKRVSYDGVKLAVIDHRRADALTLNNTTTTITGSPDYYTEWNGSVALFPAPNDAKELKLYTYNEPAEITIGSTLEVPSVFHGRLKNPVLSKMYAKDKDFNSATYYQNLWIEDKKEIKRWVRKRKRGDSFQTVIDEESLPNTILGFK